MLTEIKEESKPKIEDIKQCVICGKPFVPTRAWSRTCGKVCSRELNRRNVKERISRIASGEIEVRELPETTERITPDMLTPRTMVALVEGMFKNARRKEPEWFLTDEEKFYFDAFGIDFENKTIVGERNLGCSIKLK